MWVSATALVAELRAQIVELNTQIKDLIGRNYQLSGENARLTAENIRMQADLDWFKLHTNRVEKERAQLVQDRLGVKVPALEFMPALPDNPAEALNQGSMPDLSIVGGDAPEGFDSSQALNLTPAPDYSTLPSRANH